jgi:hydroxyacylglutathione hydrolase
MLFERIISEGIAHNSYLIGSGGKCAVIDPRRDCDVYIEIADKNDMVITHIFETHRNEDYCIGSKELVSRCGAEIYHSAQIQFSYGNTVREGDTFAFGSLELTVLETPGHTEESISLVLCDKDVSPNAYMVFCGDTLFAGDIARTDFYGRDHRAEMAAKIFDNITKKILPLGDGTIICPAHGAGSVCGGEITDHPLTSIGYEKRTNRLLLMGRQAFIELRLNESPYVPPYFRQMEKLNKEGVPILSRLPYFPPLEIKEINNLKKENAQIVDIRSPTSFASGHIPQSLSIWRDGIPNFIGYYLDYQHPIILVDDFNVGLETVLQHFVRLGYDNIRGYVAGGFPFWCKSAQEIASFQTCSVQHLNNQLESESYYLLDVRDIKNYRSVGYIKGANHIYVGELPNHLDKIPIDKQIIVYCDAGYKGSLAASYLAKNRFKKITNVLGGMTAWKKAGYPIMK